MNEQQPVPLWMTWVILLCIMTATIAGLGTSVPQTAKKFLLFPAVIFLAAGYTTQYLAKLCAIPGTKFQLMIVMCCVLTGYLGQQYLSYVAFADFQKSAKPELINLIPAIEDEVGSSPEEQEFKQRLKQQYNPGITEYLRWKYSPLTWFKHVPAIFIFIAETILTWSITCLIMWKSLSSESLNHEPGVRG